MNEAVLAGQVDRLTRAVRRWRIATFILGVLLLGSVATGGTLVGFLLVELPQQRHLELQLLAEQRARLATEQARQQAESARLDAEEARRRLQRELEEARKNGENAP